MTDTITSHGLDFVIDHQGFTTAGARADLERIERLIVERLDSLPATEVARLHAGATWDVEADRFADEAVERELAALCYAEAWKILASWHRPDEALLAVVALPNGASY